MSGEVLQDAAKNVAEEARDNFGLNELSKQISLENLIKICVVVFSVLLFYVIYKLLRRVVKKNVYPKVTEQTSLVIGKTMTYVFYVLMGMYVLSFFGINLKALWGAAGVAGLAIGFAAQTSVSNVISGLFVLGEKSIKIGDYISIGEIAGTVDFVGLLSIKIHTPDNQMVRIPNSSVISSNLINYSHYPLRRAVFEIPLKYDTDFENALKVIKTVPSKCPSVILNPEPLAYYDGIGEGMLLKLAVWFKKEDLFTVKSEVYIQIMKVCSEFGIEIPYTRLDVKLL